MEHFSWIGLLRAIPRNKHIAKENLTVAFYVGAMRNDLRPRIVAPDEARSELTGFLDRVVRQTPDDQIARVVRCISIGQPVITFSESEYIGSAANTIESSDGRVTLASSPEFAGGKQLTVGGLCEVLMEEIGTPLCEGRFSFRDGNYHPFRADEIAFIERHR